MNRVSSVLCVMVLMVLVGALGFGVNSAQATETENGAEPLSHDEYVAINRDRLIMGDYIFYLPHQKTPQELDEVMARTDWVKNTGRTLSLGYIQNEVWAKTSFKVGHTDKWHAVISYLTIDFVDFYWVLDGKFVKHDVSGDLRAFSERFYKGREISSSLDIAQDQEVTLYFKFLTEGPVLAPLTIKDDQRIAQEITNIDFALGMYYGLMFVMAIYNLILYFITRLTSYFFYVSYIGASILSRAPIDGPAFQLFWPDSPQVNTWMLPVMFWVAAFAYALFTHSFLNIRRAGWISKSVFYLMFAWLALLALAYPFSDYKTIVTLLTLTSSLFLVLGFTFALIQGVKGRLYAGVFTMATFCSMVAYIVNAMSVYGLLEDTYFALFGYPIGRTLEIILFAVALGVRIRHISKRRMEAERETAESKESAIRNLEQYERLYENSLVGNAILNAQGQVLKGNQTFYDDLDISARNNKNISIYDYFSDDLISPLFKKVDAHKQSAQGEVRDVNGKWYSMMLHWVEKPDGHEYECSIIDITDRHQAAELKEKSQQDKMNSLQQLVVGVSHEINTPLGIVGTSVDHTREILQELKLNRESGELTKTKFEQDLAHGKGVVDLAITNITRLKDMIESFKRVSVQQMSFIYGELDVENLVSGQLEVSDKLGIRTHTQLETVKGIVFNTYPSAISWILQELTQNAADHACREGMALDDIKVKMKITQTPNELEITFRDNGAGLDGMELETILDPFVTSKRGANQKLGLGLYQVYNLIDQLLKGEIELKEEQGLVVIIRIPNLIHSAVYPQNA